MDLPAISIIIVAHDKKEFLIDAVISAREQSYVRDNYEILCVKNFSDDILDAELSKCVDRVITSSKQAYGSKLLEAIEVSRGEILCFLDYDDLFSQDKLRIVYDRFTQNPNLVYLHNGRTSLKSEFNATRSIPDNKRVKHRTIDMQSARYRDLLSFFRNYPDFNSSSISVRKRILAEKESVMESLVMHPDTFLLFSALESNGVLEDDPTVLTFYRVHHSTTNLFAKSKDSFFSAKADYYSRTETDWSVIKAFLKKDGNLRLCNCETLHNSLLRKLYDPGNGRAELFREITEFISCIRSRKFFNMFLLAMISFSIFLFPLLGRYVYFAMSNKLVKQS